MLEFRGRMDEQVKIAGHRIEPDEVARALERVDGVRQACVVVQDDQRGRRLVAYHVSDRPQPAHHLEDALTRWLPPFMLPADYIVLDALPLTTSGKIDRAALPKARGQSCRHAHFADAHGGGGGPALVRGAGAAHGAGQRQLLCTGRRRRCA